MIDTKWGINTPLALQNAEGSISLFIVLKSTPKNKKTLILFNFYFYYL